MDKPSQKYLAETEVIFHIVNDNVAEFIIDAEGSDTTTTIPFYCECSKEVCRDRLRLTPQTYKKLHKNKRQFVVKTGHDIPEIEKIVERHRDYYVIEKYGDPPLPANIKRVLKKLRV